MPNRIIREGILDSERVGQLSVEAELFYRKLMSIVDDYGRFEANVKTLRARLYSQRLDRVGDLDIESYLSECSAGDEPLVRVYMAGTKRFLEIQNFGQQKRAEKSKCPPPLSVDSKCVADDMHPLSDAHSRAGAHASDYAYASDSANANAPEGGLEGTKSPPPMFDMDGWNELILLGDSIQMVLDPSNDSDLYRHVWRLMSNEEKLLSVQVLRRRIESGQYNPKQTLIPSLRTYLKEKRWRETDARPRASPNPVDRQQAERDQAVAELTRRAAADRRQ